MILAPFRPPSQPFNTEAHGNSFAVLAPLACETHRGAAEVRCEPIFVSLSQNESFVLFVVRATALGITAARAIAAYKKRFGRRTHLPNPP